MGGSIDEDNHRSASADTNQKPKLLPLVTPNFTIISGAAGILKTRENVDIS